MCAKDLTLGTGTATILAVLRPVAFALIALTMAACTSGPAEPDMPADPTPAPATLKATTGPVPISPGDRSKLKPPVRNPDGSAAPEVSENDVRDLIGRNEAEVLSRLGEPSLRREAPPTRVWHYGSTGCTVDLVFFFDMASGEHRLALFRGPAEGTAETDDVRCLAKAATERRAGS